jgi:hypothetical protein
MDSILTASRCVDGQESREALRVGWMWLAELEQLLCFSCLMEIRIV